MEVGVVRVAEDKDYSNLKSLIDNHSGWKLDYNKNSIKVWTKNLPDCSFKMVKVIAVFPDIPGDVIYDVLHDPDYRRLWDQHMIESKDIGFLNPNNDVGYYSMSCPSPLANRDFVLQRSWLDLGKEKYILNHSVYHKDYPPKKGFIRATSHLTGFFIKNDESGGCSLGYISQTDPQGTLPPWLVNKVTQILGPKMVKNLQKATLGYEDWKRSNNPLLKPWIFPEQITSPRLSLSVFDVSKEEQKEVEIIKPGGNLLDSIPSISYCKFSLLSVKSTQLSLAKSDSALNKTKTDEQQLPTRKLRSDTTDFLNAESDSTTIEYSCSKTELVCANIEPSRFQINSHRSKSESARSITDATSSESSEFVIDPLEIEPLEIEPACKNLKSEKGDSIFKRKIFDKSKKQDKVKSDKNDPNSTPGTPNKEKKKSSAYSKLKNSIRKKTGLSPKK